MEEIPKKDKYSKEFKLPRKAEQAIMSSSTEIFLMKKIDDELCVFNSRVRFTVQSGETFNLTEKEIFAKFTDFGKIDTVSFTNSNYKCSGNIVFSSKTAAKRSLNKVVEVKDCLLHISTDFGDLSPFPSGHQILIESENFPKSWERSVIIKDFFQKLGEVTGINLKSGRLVVSFKEDIASQIISTLVQVP